MFKKLLALIFPKDKLVIESWHLPVVLNYQRRLARCAALTVASEARGPYQMAFVCDTPGRYVSNGKGIRWTISAKHK